jgi:hypothetical protein
MALNVISWNIGGRADAWRQLLDTDVDVALLQEAREPPKDVAARVEVDGEPWSTNGADAQRPWRAAVVRLSNRVRGRWHKPIPIEQAGSGDLGVSRRGTLAAADIIDADETPYTMVSMY